MVAQFSRHLTLVPPQNIEAEEAILGGILLDPEALSRVADFLRPEMFSLIAHQTIYKTAIELRGLNRTTDFITMAGWLNDNNLLDKIGGQSKLLQLVERTVSAVNIDQYAKLVVEKYKRREVIRLGNEIVSEGYAGKDLIKLIDKLEGILNDARDELGPGASLVEKVKAIREIESPVEQWHAWQRLCQKTRYSKRELLDLAMAAETDLEIEIHSAQEFSQKKLVKDKFLMEGLLRRGTVALLTAEAKTGKSLLHYHLTYHIASGVSWGDFNVSSGPNNCLIIQTDESKVELQERTIVRGLAELPNVDLVTEFAPSQLTRLKKKIIEKGYDFIVLDSLTSINRLSGYGENDQEFSFFVYELKELAESTGACILLVHHTNKCPVALGLDKVAGHSSITRAPSDIFILHRPKAGNETHRILSKVATRDAARSSLKLDINPEDNSYDFLGYCNVDGELIEEADSTENLTLSQKIFDFLAIKPGTAYQATEISQLCSIAQGYCRNACGTLWRQGRIMRKKVGKAFAYFVEKATAHTPNDVQLMCSSSTLDGESVSSVAAHLHTQKEEIYFEKNLEDASAKIKKNIFPKIDVQMCSNAQNPYADEILASAHQLHIEPPMCTSEPAETTEQEINAKVEEIRIALPYLALDGQWSTFERVFNELGQAMKEAVWARLTKEEQDTIRSFKPKPEPTSAPTELKPASQPKLEIDDKVAQKVDDAFRYGTVTGLSDKNVFVTWDKKKKKEPAVTESVDPDTLTLISRKPKFETNNSEKLTNQKIHRLSSYQAGQFLTKRDGKILGTITARGKEGKEGIYYECASTKLTKFVSFDDIDLYEYQRFWP